MPMFNDADGRQWSAKKVGRTSGFLISGTEDGANLEPSDIVRFDCQIDGRTVARETTVKAGLFDRMTRAELQDLFEKARPV